MLTTKVFKSGNSQAVRIPKEYQVAEKELCINKIGNTLILFPESDSWERLKRHNNENQPQAPEKEPLEEPWERFKQSLTECPDGFLADGNNP